MEIGERIRSRRIELRMTQRELAQRIQVDPSSVRNYETGRSIPRALILRKLGRVLQISLRRPVSPMTPHQLRLKPGSISEEEWRSELQGLYEFHLQSRKDFDAVSGFATPDIELEAAVSARQTQLWAHDVVPNPSRGGPTYKLTTDDQGRKVWKSNVRESAVEEEDGKSEKGPPA